MKLKELSLRDSPVFGEYLGLSRHELSVYAFTNIYIWKGLFTISWTVISDSLCVFFRDKLGCFLYLTPLAKEIKPEVINQAFRVMDGFNRNKEISRIENAEEADVAAYRELGYVCQCKSYDYLCLKDRLTDLKGNLFKPKRSSYNYFTKNYSFQYLPYVPEYKDACLGLYRLWGRQRKEKNSDIVYQGMIEDSGVSLKVFLEAYPKSGSLARVVIIGTEVKAFTCGFRLNNDTFCILYEITDLSIKGLSQFIFRQFCRELKEYRYINIMDDSGLENLKQVKLSYRPQRLIPAYIVKRNYA